MTSPTTRETADHAELSRLAEAARGDFELPIEELRRIDEAFMAAFTPAVCSALLSEIAALRGEAAHLEELYETTGRQCDRWKDRATQAERQRDELRKALEPFSESAESLDDEARDHDHIWERPAAMSINAGHLRTARTLIANQGADQ